MSEISFSAAQKAEIVDKIKNYFEASLDQQIGQFDAEFLLDFFAVEMGGYFYNQGLNDAQAALAQKLEEIQYAITDLEKPIKV